MRKRVSRTVEFEIMRTFQRCAARARGACSLALGGLERILHGRVLVELDVIELSVTALDPADVDVLDDVARAGIDRNRPARALPRHALHGGEQRVAIGVAAGLLQRGVDEMHGVVDRDADVVRALPTADALEKTGGN